MPEPPPGPRLHLDLTAPREHLVRVRLVFVPRTGSVTARLPAWTPGSYLLRDYVRTLEQLQVRQGDRTPPCDRIEPAAWRIAVAPGQPVELRYRILATELSVRTCHLNGDHGFLALAGVALQIEGERWRPHRLELALPSGWEAFVPLPRAADGSWCARDFDQLIDTPVEAGPHPCHDFAVAGVPHRWVTWGEDLPERDDRWLADVERVCRACCRLMGQERPPEPDPYLFVLHLLEEGYGGLEHDSSCVLQYGRRALARPEGRRKLLQLVAHEYLHRWNVRRLRPAELTPIDYDRPMVVPSLWFAEGITSYFDQLLPLAAGCSGQEELLADLGEDLSRFLLTPGRRVQSLSDSSREAWVKLYRRDVHAADNQISYYLKGAVLALVLDLHLRRHASALSAVLRDLWRSHGRWRRGYRAEDLIAAFAGHAADLSTLLPNWLESHQDPDLKDYLADVGLTLAAETASHPAMGWQVEGGAAAGGLRLKRVERSGPAQRAGLQSGDELLAIDGRRLLRAEDLPPLLTAAGPGEREVLFCRDGRIRAASVQPGPPEVERWRLSIDPQAPPEAAGRRARWLTLEP
ncbi:MAG: PDZ domain-containing protein [Synechococcaceae cyanobacterium]|nr:PDZ domain-containing protein [Synechococcaceae cyanobacterium]